MKSMKIIVEKHPDGYIAYPLGIQGVVVGEGDTYEDALNDTGDRYSRKIDSPKMIALSKSTMIAFQK